MTWTTVPSLVVALAIFTVLGIGESRAQSQSAVAPTMALLDANFAINPLLLAPVALVVFLAARKVPAVATIMSGVLAGIVLAVFFQPQAVRAMGGDIGESGALLMFRGVWTVLFEGFAATTGDIALDSLLSPWRHAVDAHHRMADSRRHGVRFRHGQGRHSPGSGHGPGETEPQHRQPNRHHPEHLPGG